MRYPRFAVLIFALAFAVNFVGCAAFDSPADKYDKALLAGNALQSTFIASANSGLLTDEQIAGTKELFLALDRQIEILRQHYHDNTPAGQAALDTVWNLINSIRQWMAVTQRKE